MNEAKPEPQPQPQPTPKPGGGWYAVSYADSRPGRRRRGGPRLTDRTLNVALGAELDELKQAAGQ